MDVNKIKPQICGVKSEPWRIGLDSRARAKETNGSDGGGGGYEERNRVPKLKETTQDLGQFKSFHFFCLITRRPGYFDSIGNRPGPMFLVDSKPIAIITLYPLINVMVHAFD